MKRERLIVFFVTLNISLFYGWKFLYGDNLWLAALGVNVMQTTVLIFSVIFLHRAYRRTKDKQRKFWGLLTIGGLTYLAANFSWFFYTLQGNSLVYSDISYSLWLGAYTFFLAALIYYISWIKHTTYNQVYFFNIIIFMITAAAINIHYLIDPILEFADNSIWNTMVTLAYPIIDMSIMFVVIILYYLIRNDKEKGPMILLILGFTLHVMADTYSAYMDILQNYTPATLADLLWLLSLWLIGLAGFYVTEDREESIVKIEETFEKLEIILPYICTTALLIMVIDSYQWELNALSLGLSIILLIIIARQLYIMRENNKLIDEYKHLAYHDPLTGLKNREYFEEYLENEMRKSKNNATALLLIDLDRFKVINDTLGHQAGDYILIKISNYLQQALESNAEVFRLGGDEFAIILPNATEEKCVHVTKTILEKFNDPFLIHDHEIIVTASVGISLYPIHGLTYEDMFKFADAAMYLAKEGGKNGYRFYDDDLNQVMARKMRVESGLRKALEENQFEVFYQPKVELKTKKIKGMEALLRWNHPEIGWISPAEFIPIAEETGQIVPIGEWVLKSACKQNKRWQEMGLPLVNVSVNVSVRQFQHGTLLSVVGEALLESELHPRFLEIEVTESVMQNTAESTAILMSLRNRGIRVSIDDFGKGYSSLHMIQQLPIDTIKLDKSFIDDIGNKTQQVMVKTIINLGINLNLDVVAEGIESEYQLNKLIESDCLIGQGYLFSKAVTAEKMEAILRMDDDLSLEEAYSYI